MNKKVFKTIGKILLTLAGAFILFVLTCNGYFLYSKIQRDRLDRIFCREDNLIPPIAPVYPNATLISQSKPSLDFGGSMYFDYLSTDSPDRIIAFYESFGGTCKHSWDDTIGCSGSTVEPESGFYGAGQRSGTYAFWFGKDALANYTTTRKIEYQGRIEWTGCRYDPDRLPPTLIPMGAK